MTRTKKIIIFIVVIAVIGAGLYWYLSNNQSTGAGGTGNGSFSIRNFFPFGNPDTNSGNQNTPTSVNTQSSGGENIFGGNVPLAKLRKLSDKPISGAVIWTSGSTSVVRFVEKATGNVYEAYSDSSSIKRLTNETIPKIIRAIWLPDGSGFLAQTLDDNETIETSFIKLKVVSSSTAENLTPYEPVISKLPTGIAELSPSPDSKKIFYISTDSATHGYISNPDGTSKSEVFSNFLSEWLPNWFGSNLILLSSKASAQEESFGYFLNPAGKTLVKTYSGIVGGTALSRLDGKYLVLGQGGDSASLYLLNAANGTTTALGINSFAEKCSWDPSDLKFIYCAVPKSASPNLPDAWYQGTFNSNDIVEKINVFDLYKYLLVDPESEVRTPIDAENLSASKNGFLIFENKNDQSLWILDAR